MVKAVFCYQEQNIINVSISGHAFYNDYGKDIVCAGISAIVIGTSNALNELLANEEVIVNIDDTKTEFVFKVIKANTKNQIILKTMLWQLKTIADNYQDYLEIKEVK